MIQISNPAVLSAVCAYYNAFSRLIQDIGWFFVNRLGNQLSAQSVRNVINTYTALAGIDQHITPHMFRHSFATLRVQVILNGGLDQAEHNRTAGGTLQCIGKQEVLSVNDEGLDTSLGTVVAQFQPPVF